MSETKHTPGPWEYFEQKEWGRDSMYGCVRAPQSAGGFVIVNGCAPGGTEEQKANARLIAAAPDTAAERDKLKEINAKLLAACKELRAVLVTIETKDPNLSAKQGAIIRDICSKAEAAIAEAEPKQG